MNSRIIKALAIGCAVASLAACSTTGQFVVPKDTQLFLGGRPQPVPVSPEGTVTVRAFGWHAMGVPPAKGIPYRLEKGGQTVQEGRLRSVLRPASFFWPPFAGIFTVPTGLNPHITYNLVTGKQE